MAAILMTMLEYAQHYSEMEEGDLAQIVWDGVDSLNPEARSAFEAELKKRGKTAEGLKRDYPELEPPKLPQQTSKDTYLHALWFALREMLAERKARDWVPTTAVIDDSSHTAPVIRGVIRAEIRYHYSVDSRRYDGKIVRDFITSASAELMVGRFSAGDSVEIRFDPNQPSRSYLSSGVGYAGSVAIGASGLLVWAILVTMWIAVLASRSKHP